MNDLYGPLDEKKKKRKKAGSESSKESSLRDWFGRKGAKGKKKGWVDCNSPDGKGGYKSCGRGSGEKRKKYPACRPTPGACKERGRGKSWGKKAKKKSKKNEELYMDLEQIIQEELAKVLKEMDPVQESFIDAIVNRKTHKVGKKALAQLQVYANDPGAYKDSIESLYKDLKQLEKAESPAAISLYDALKLARELRQKAASAPSSAAEPQADSDRYDIDSPERVKQRGDQRRRLSQYKKDQDDERRRAKQRARDNVRRGFDAGLVDYSDTLEEIVREELETYLLESHSKEDEEELKKISDELKGAVKMHQSQADRIDKILDSTEDDDLKEENEVAEGMNCGCGNDPCETYGKNNEKIIVTIKEELEAVLDEKRKKKKKKAKRDACYNKVKSRYKVWPSAYASGALVKCRKVGAANWGNSKKESLDIMIEDELAQVLDEKKKKACKPSKGKRFAKRVNGKCRSYGQKGQAKGGGDRIRPGTKKGDAYCARSAKIKKCKNPPCANALSRKKWKCRGSKSMKE